MQVERMKSGIAFVIRAVYRILVTAILKTCREAGHIGKVLAPVNAKTVTVSVGREVGQPGNGITSFAVVGLCIVDRPGKVAAIKDPAGKIEPAGVGNRLVAGIGPRLVVIGRKVKGHKIGIVVETGKGAGASQSQIVA